MNNFIVVNDVKWKYIPDEEGMLIENDPEPNYFYLSDEVNLYVAYNDWTKEWFGLVNHQCIPGEYNTPEEAAQECLNYIHQLSLDLKNILNVHNYKPKEVK